VLLSQGEISAGETVMVVGNTRPVYDFLALVQHSASAESDLGLEEINQVLALEDAARRDFEPIEVDVVDAEPDGCKWESVPSLADPSVNGNLVIEVSNVVTNPTTGEAGVFVRFSFEGRGGAIWYWCSLEDSAAGWRVTRSYSLAVSDG
jgi:hypothetical protein